MKVNPSMANRSGKARESVEAIDQSHISKEAYSKLLQASILNFEERLIKAQKLREKIITDQLYQEEIQQVHHINVNLKASPEEQYPSISNKKIVDKQGASQGLNLSTDTFQKLPFSKPEIVAKSNVLAVSSVADKQNRAGEKSVLNNQDILDSKDTGSKLFKSQYPNTTDEHPRKLEPSSAPTFPSEGKVLPKSFNKIQAGQNEMNTAIKPIPKSSDERSKYNIPALIHPSSQMDEKFNAIPSVRKENTERSNNPFIKPQRTEGNNYSNPFVKLSGNAEISHPVSAIEKPGDKIQDIPSLKPGGSSENTFQPLIHSEIKSEKPQDNPSVKSIESLGKSNNPFSKSEIKNEKPHENSSLTSAKITEETEKANIHLTTPFKRNEISENREEPKPAIIDPQSSDEKHGKVSSFVANPFNNPKIDKNNKIAPQFPSPNIVPSNDINKNPFIKPSIASGNDKPQDPKFLSNQPTNETTTDERKALAFTQTDPNQIYNKVTTPQIKPFTNTSNPAEKGDIPSANPNTNCLKATNPPLIQPIPGTNNLIEKPNPTGLQPIKDSEIKKSSGEPKILPIPTTNSLIKNPVSPISNPTTNESKKKFDPLLINPVAIPTGSIKDSSDAPFSKLFSLNNSEKTSEIVPSLAPPKVPTNATALVNDKNSKFIAAPTRPLVPSNPKSTNSYNPPLISPKESVGGYEITKEIYNSLLPSGNKPSGKAKVPESYEEVKNPRPKLNPQSKKHIAEVDQLLAIQAQKKKDFIDQKKPQNALHPPSLKKITPVLKASPVLNRSPLQRPPLLPQGSNRLRPVLSPYSDELPTYEQLLELDSKNYDPGNGFSVSELHHLQIVRFKLSMSVSQCSICQEDYLPEDEICWLPCQHEFHYNCIFNWLQRRKNCPLKCEIDFSN